MVAAAAPHTAAPAALVLPPELKRDRDRPLVTVTDTAVRPAAPPRGRRLHLEPLWELLVERLELDFSPSTLWRLLDEHALRPWRTRYWIFPRDPRFVELASPVLDLYAGQ